MGCKYCDEEMLKYETRGECLQEFGKGYAIEHGDIKAFIEKNHRNPSKYNPEEKLMVHFLKRGRKLMNADEMKEPRLTLFKELLALAEENKHVNQYA